MKTVWYVALVLVAICGMQLQAAPQPEKAKGSLLDDKVHGCATEFQVNRSIPAVRFNFPNRPMLELQGEPAGRWIERAKTESMLGGAFVKDPIIALEKNKKGEYIASVIRFALGCMFVSKDRVVLLDWNAVKKWEAAGGYKKLGIPKKDDYKVRVRIVPPSHQSDI